LTSARERTRPILLRAVASVVQPILVLWTAWRNLEERIRSSLLGLCLTLIYFLLVTSLAWQKRSDQKNEIARWRIFGGRIGWRPNEQSTSNPQVYLSSVSSRDDMIALMRMNRIDHSTLLLYDVLSPLKFLAKPPKEKELSSDLYVMF
jgi:hypothetical protein